MHMPFCLFCHALALFIFVCDLCMRLVQNSYHVMQYDSTFLFEIVFSKINSINNTIVDLDFSHIPQR